jgi:FMN reductase
MNQEAAPLIVGFGGTSRRPSSSDRALRLALSEAERYGAVTEGFFGAELAFAMYQPHEAVNDDRALRFVNALRRADGIIIASPGYHGGISGLIKNAIDYTELLREDARPYFEGRAVGCIACAAGWQATAATLASLRSIVHALRGWPTPLGAALNSSCLAFADDGTCTDRHATAQLACIARQVVFFGNWVGKGAKRCAEQSVQAETASTAASVGAGLCGQLSAMGEGIS